MGTAPQLESDPPIRLRTTQPWVVLIVFVAFALQWIVASGIEGYQLADSVEYLDRAYQIAEGRRLDPSTARSFAFSALLTPFFWIAREFDIQSYGGIVHLVRFLEMLVGLATILAVMRITAALSTRRAALASGWVLAVHPVFLRYTVTPLSGPVAMLFVALAIEALIRPGGFRRGLRGGLLLGAGILMAFQVLPIAGAALLGLALRDRRAGLPMLGGAVAGVSVGLLIQSSLDAVVYAGFGSSLGTYARANLSGIGTKILFQLGWVSMAKKVYGWGLGSNFDRPASELVLRQRDAPDFYQSQFHSEFFPWVLTAFLALGACALIRKRRGTALWLLFITGTNAYLLTTKGSKSFRLVLPLLPIFGVLTGVGWQALTGASRTSGRRRWTRARPALATLAFAVGLILSARMALALNLKQHGGYWRAMEYVNSAASTRSATDPKVRVASAYYWAIAMRQSPHVSIVKLPRTVLEVQGASTTLSPDRFDVLDSADWFVGHMNLLWRSPELMRALNERFEVVRFEYDGPTSEGIAPVCVLRRRTAGTTRSFFGVENTPAPASHPSSIQFAGPDGAPWIEFGGFDVETGLADNEVCWITFRWRSLTPDLPDLALTRGLEDADGRSLLVGYHGFTAAYGALPTSEWAPGRWILESYPAMVATDPLQFGGAFARGEQLPVQVSVGVSRRTEDGLPEPLRLIDPASGSPATAPPPEPDPQAAPRRVQGNRIWDRMGRPVAGGFWLPVPSEARVPDDGRPLGSHR